MQIIGFLFKRYLIRAAAGQVPYKAVAVTEFQEQPHCRSCVGSDEVMTVDWNQQPKFTTS
jgi:hypothetical protein